jgi:hypothetical protein
VAAWILADLGVRPLPETDIRIPMSIEQRTAAQRRRAASPSRVAGMTQLLDRDHPRDPGGRAGPARSRTLIPAKEPPRAMTTWPLAVDTAACGRPEGGEGLMDAEP